MITTNYTAKYIPVYVLDNVPWYERDGLPTYIDQLKYKKFCEDCDKHFENTQVINLDIMNHQFRGKLLRNPVQYYISFKKDEHIHTKHIHLKLERKPSSKQILVPRTFRGRLEDVPLQYPQDVP